VCIVTTDHGVRCDGSPSRLPSLGSVTQISVGRDPRAGIARGCAVLETGALVCWGPDYCADGSTVCATGTWNEPRKVLDATKQVSVGTYLACAVRTDGTVWCWGRADEGGLGDEAPTISRIAKVDLVHLAR
jgi:alpha-tubulin suppressor-like RCC1 family protein